MTKNRYHFSQIVWMAILLITFILASFPGIESFWGINLLTFHSTFWFYLCISFVFLFSVPAVGRKIIYLLDTMSMILSTNRTILVATFSLVSFGAIYMFVSFEAATDYLGDGHLRVNQVLFGRVFLPTEFLDFLSHALLYEYIFHPLGFTVMKTYQAYSAVLGVVFIIGIYRLSSYLRPERWITLFLMMVTSGVSVLFFGYIESYSLIAALLPFLILQGLRTLDCKSSKWSYTILFLFTILSHGIAVILFTPSMLFVAIQRAIDSESRLIAIFKVLGTSLFFLISLIHVFRAFDYLNISRYVLPLFSDNQSDVGVFTIAHGLDVFNILFLAGLPFLVLILPCMQRRELKHTSGLRRQIFSILIIAPSMLFLIFFNPLLSAPRDWDLFSLAGFLFIPSILIIYFSNDKTRPLPAYTVPFLVISIGLLFSFVAVNQSIPKATDRFVKLLELAPVVNHFKEYNLLRNYAEDFSSISDRKLEFALKAWEQPPYNNGDSVLILNELSEYYKEIGNEERSLSYITLSLRIDSTSLISHHFLLNHYRRFGSRQSIRNVADLLNRRFSGDARGMMDAGTLYFEMGDYEKGGDALEEAYELDSLDVFVAVNYSIYLIQRSEFERATQILSRTIHSYPRYYLANYNLAVAYLGIGNQSLALEFVQRASDLSTNRTQNEQIQKLRAVMRK